jgi:hypothetical protein
LSEGENPTSCTGNGRPASGAIDNPWTSRNSRNAGKPPRRLFLGVDGGGTSTEACVMDHRGTVLGIGRGGPSNINYVDQTELADSIRTAVNKCLALSGISLDDIAGACLALAGAGDENPKTDPSRRVISLWRTALSPSSRTLTRLWLPHMEAETA